MLLRLAILFGIYAFLAHFQKDLRMGDEELHTIAVVLMCLAVAVLYFT